MVPGVGDHGLLDECFALAGNDERAAHLTQTLVGNPDHRGLNDTIQAGQHPLDLPEHRLRLGLELQRMRQQHRVHGLGLDRERARMADAVAPVAGVGDQEPSRDPRQRQERVRRAPVANLQEIVAKYVVQRRFKRDLLRSEQKLPERACQPVVERIGRDGRGARHAPEDTGPAGPCLRVKG